MRVPWFNWRASGRGEDVSLAACCVPHERTDDEISLALRLIPLYQIRLRNDDSPTAQRPRRPLDVALATALGAERAQRALRELAERGSAVVAVCPLELAEHYRDELARSGVMCDIRPA